MADLFRSLSRVRSLGNMMKDIATMLPQNTEGGEKSALQGEMETLTEKAELLYAQIGRMACEQYGEESFGETGLQLKEMLDSIAALRREREERRRAQEAQIICSGCGYACEEGVRFCPECGMKLERQNQRICPQCGAAYEEGRRFCGECGANLAAAAACPECGAQLESGVKFCGECGTRIE